MQELARIAKHYIDKLNTDLQVLDDKTTTSVEMALHLVQINIRYDCDETTALLKDVRKTLDGMLSPSLSNQG